MTNIPILTRFQRFSSFLFPQRPNLHQAFLMPDRLPAFVSQSPSAMRMLHLLGPIDWQAFPERNLARNWGNTTVPFSAFCAAYLIKLNEHLVSMHDLRQYLIEQPSFIWLLGFPLKPSRRYACGFDPEASLPTERHLTRMLRKMPNSSSRFVFLNSANLLLQHFSLSGIPAGECISLDTKHIIAWVKENNPKSYIQDKRYDKTNQPLGDPDCRIGCKRKHNKQTHATTSTPLKNGIPAELMEVGEFYWGYGSGVVVVKVPDYGEFVLAEMTQTFDQPDVSYFFPLMAKTEQILGFKPRFGTFDAAFDAWYVYDFFHRSDDPDAFAAVPFSEKGGYKAKGRQFTSEGLPICPAGLPMPLKFTYHDNTISIIPHERGKYVCPLRFPQQQAQVCPVNHPHSEKKGCTVSMPVSIGARLRYTIDRDTQAYKDVYRQRTATERINSQAVALGIERPHIRNGAAIENTNTLIYTLINLRLLERLQHKN